MLRAQLLNDFKGQAAVAAKGVRGSVHVRILPMTYEAYQKAEQAYRHGQLIQQAFAGLSPSDRSFLMDGGTPSQWYALFGSEDEDGEDLKDLREEGPHFLTDVQYQKVYAGEISLEDAYDYNRRQIEQQLAESSIAPSA